MRWPLRGVSGRDAAETAPTAEEQRDRGMRTGEILRQARTMRGATLADVERDTKINRAYIEALEAARFDTLPAPVYARGFMRSYARYLGLDPDEAVRAIPRDMPRPAGLEPSAGLRRTPPMALPSLPSIPLTSPIVLGGAAVLIVLLLGVFVAPRFLGGGTPGASATATPPADATVTIEVPNVVGLTREQASATLERAQLTWIVFPSDNAAPAGQVFRQSPPVGFAAKKGEQVTLFVSQGPGTSSTTPAQSPTATPSRTPTATATATR